MPINTSVLDNQWRWRPAASGSGCRTKYFPEAASSNFKYGEPVIVTTSGGVDYVTQMITRPSAGNVSGSLAATDFLLGWALAPATTTTGSPIPVLLAKDVEVLLRVYNATASASEPQDVAVGDLAEIFRFNPNDATNNTFAVISAAPNGTDGINKMIVVEKYSVDMRATNAAFAGEQDNADDYGLVWATVRPAFTAQGH